MTMDRIILMIDRKLSSLRQSARAAELEQGDVELVSRLEAEIAETEVTLAKLRASAQ